MKSSSSDLEELNCWYKNLDVGLDASEFGLVSSRNLFAGRIEKSYLPHMTSFLAEIRGVDSSLS